jgi:hypothetical protein
VVVVVAAVVDVAVVVEVEQQLQLALKENQHGLEKRCFSSRLSLGVVSIGGRRQSLNSH